jgi:hypothetical protein
LSGEVTLKIWKKSPYIADPNRLADVIAAIQAMGVYRFHMCSFGRWAERISGDASRGEYWMRIFEDHPEFFRLDTSRKMASLVWRRQLRRRFDVDADRLVPEHEYRALSPKQRKRISRPPLSPADIEALIETAISLHTRAVELQQERRWWITILSSALGGLAGAILGAFIRGY